MVLVAEQILGPATSHYEICPRNSRQLIGLMARALRPLCLCINLQIWAHADVRARIYCSLIMTKRRNNNWKSFPLKRMRLAGSPGSLGLQMKQLHKYFIALHVMGNVPGDDCSDFRDLCQAPWFTGYQ